MEPTATIQSPRSRIQTYNLGVLTKDGKFNQN
jgi:hypothetical protein